MYSHQHKYQYPSTPAFTTEIIDGADFEENDIPFGRRTVMILLSQSGETKDLYRALELGKRFGIKSLGLINVENSLIAREVDACIYINAGREYAVASTKSFTNHSIALLLLALWMTPKLDKTLKSQYLVDLSNLVGDFLAIIEQANTECQQMISYFKGQNSCFILGKSQTEWIAKEGALKIKEISYIHAEGYSASALKHGPFALLTHGIPVIFIATNDQFYPKIDNITEEVKSRLATVIYITNIQPKEDKAKYTFHYKSDSVLFPLLSIVPLQMLSYYLALDRGHHPDFPRNLAKVVTVE